jgi:hypothetical protein
MVLLGLQKHTGWTSKISKTDDIYRRHEMQVSLVYTLREDGGLDYAVGFGDAEPWDLLEENIISCATDVDAMRLKKKIEDMLSALAANVECSVYEEDVLPSIEGAFVVGVS